MKRKMVAIGISYILGLFFASFLSQEHFWLIGAAGMIVFMLLLLMKRFSARVLLVSAVFFFGGAGIYAGYTADAYIPAVALAGKENVFSGRVSSAEVYDGEYASYIADGAFADGTKASVLCFTQNYDCRYGDHIQVTGTFSVPDGSYLFDSEEYYKSQSVFLEADSGCEYSVMYVDDCRLLRKIAKYRDKIQRRIYYLSGRTGGSLTAAMIFGDRSGLDERIESSFYHSGLGPMLALSGFHLILFNGVCNAIGNRTRLQRILQFGLTVLLTTLFTLVSMWPVSVLRAGCMLLIARGSCLFFRRSDSLSALCISVILLTGLRPYLIHNVGFLLSVAGTFGVNSFAPWITNRLPLYGWVGGIVKSALSAALVSLCTIPICICHFTETSLLAPISNVIFAPMCVIIMFCGIVIFFCGGAGGISHICGYIIDIVSSLLTDWLRWLEMNVPISFPCGWSTLGTAAAVLSAVVILVYMFSRSRKFVCPVIAASVFAMAAGLNIRREQFEDSLHLFILGRKDEQIIAVTYNGRTDVTDLTGDRKNGDHLLRLLTEYGISRVDSLYIAENADSSAAVYDKLLYACDVECVMTATENEFPDDKYICSQPLVDTDYCCIEASDYSTSVKDGCFSISAFGKSVFVTQQEPSEYTAAGYDYIVSGKNKKNTVFDMSGDTGKMVVSAGQNIEIIIHADSSVVARRLD